METDFKNEDEIPRYGFGKRHIQVFLMGAGNGLNFLIWNSLPTCIVAMTSTPQNSPPGIPVFPQWRDQTVILSAFGWGFTFTQLSSSFLEKKFGYKNLMVTANAISVVSFLFTPYITIHFEQIGLFLCFCIQGLSLGCTVTVLSEFINVWVPSSEITSLGNAIFSTFGIGCILATYISGSLSVSRWGWPSVFYFIGFIGIIWVTSMFFFGVSSPEKHKTITKEELYFIVHDKKSAAKNSVIPWKEILTSNAVWSLWSAHIGSQIMYWMFYIEFPTYLNRVFEFNVESIAEILTLSYLISWIFGLISSKIGDHLLNKGTLKRGLLRILCSSIATYGSSLCMIIMSFLRENDTILVLCLIPLNFFLLSPYCCGVFLNYNDISTNYSGLLISIGWFLSSLTASLVALVAQLSMTNLNDPNQWSILIWCCISILVITNIYFSIFCSGDVQTWDFIQRDVEGRSSNENQPLIRNESVEILEE